MLHSKFRVTKSEFIIFPKNSAWPSCHPVSFHVSCTVQFSVVALNAIQTGNAHAHPMHISKPSLIPIHQPTRPGIRPRPLQRRDITFSRSRTQSLELLLAAATALWSLNLPQLHGLLSRRNHLDSRWDRIIFAGTIDCLSRKYGTGLPIDFHCFFPTS